MTLKLTEEEISCEVCELYQHMGVAKTLQQKKLQKGTYKTCTMRSVMNTFKEVKRITYT